MISGGGRGGVELDDEGEEGLGKRLPTILVLVLVLGGPPAGLGGSAHLRPTSAFWISTSSTRMVRPARTPPGIVMGPLIEWVRVRRVSSAGGCGWWCWCWGGWGGC